MSTDSANDKSLFKMISEGAIDTLKGRGAKSQFELPWLYALGIPAVGGGFYAGYAGTRALLNKMYKREQERAIEKLHKRLNSQMLKQQMQKRSAYEVYKDMRKGLSKEGNAAAWALTALMLGAGGLGTYGFLNTFKPQNRINVKNLRDDLIRLRASRTREHGTPTITFGVQDVVRTKKDSDEEDDL